MPVLRDRIGHWLIEENILGGSSGWLALKYVVSVTFTLSRKLASSVDKHGAG